MTTNSGTLIPTPTVAPSDRRVMQLRRMDRVGLFALVCICIAFVVVLGRVAQLQIYPSSALQPFMQERVSRRVEPAPRGDLLDRRGRVIHATRAGYRLFIDPSEFAEPFGPKVNELAEVLNVDVDEVAERTINAVQRSRERVAEGQPPLRYVVFPRVLDDAQVEAARNLSIPGVHLERRNVRETPGAEHVESIAGKVGLEDKGLIGAEAMYDSAMHSTAGYMDYVRDARGRPMWIEANGFTTPRRGEPVRLSIDLVMQEIAYEELKHGVEQADAAGGRLVMVDPDTGEILALVDYIRDLHGLAEVDPKQPIVPGVRYRTIRKDPGREVHPGLGRNRCVEDIYEPGSTFKAFVWSSITERGRARTDEWIETYNGSWHTDYGRPVRDVVPMPRLKWSDVLVYSSNIGMVQMSNRLTFQELRSDIVRFGFGKRTGIGIAGESPGLVTNQKAWSKYTQTSVASGYEIGVTPVQMVRAFSAFARRGEKAGTLPTLRLTALEDRDATMDFEYRVLPRQIAELTRRTMKDVAENMAKRAAEKDSHDTIVPGGMFGKSGTAEIAKPNGKGYIDHQYNSSFIAGAPLDDPRLVVLVVIDDPGPAYTTTRRYFGSQVAGPVVLRVMHRALDYLGANPPVEPETPEVIATAH